MSESTDITEIRTAVRQLCAQYGEDYWLELDRTRGYPTEFVSELTKSGFLTVLIPENYGGAGARCLRGIRHHGRSLPVWRPRRCLPRANVRHGFCAAAR